MVIFEVIGLTVSIAAGIAIAAFSLALAIQYAWRTFREAHSIREIQQAALIIKQKKDKKREDQDGH